MAGYFDLTEDGELLTKAARDHEDIELLASDAEYDIIDHYTKTIDNRANTPLQVGGVGVRTGAENLFVAASAPTVHLLYYKEDPTEPRTFTSRSRASTPTISKLRAIRTPPPGRTLPRGS